jgi:hypothetical protein
VKGYRLELQRRHPGICLLLNGELTTQCWKVSEVEAPYLKMNNGEHWPDGSQYGYYVIGRMGTATGIYIFWGRKSERELISA